MLAISMIYQAYIIVPYLSLDTLLKNRKLKNNAISILSVNVLQKNNEYSRLIDLVEEVQPDILLTMETDHKWDAALEKIESHYSNSFKIPKDNTYGMHFYTKLKTTDIREHYFISNDRPAIEAHLTDNNGNDFIFWGMHPPPPSPTEKPTSKQKDAELMKVAKLIRSLKSSSIVTGDFNNVCWSRSAKLFAKTANLKDARLGNGIHGTFPVRPNILRFPLDLLFSSQNIDIHELKTLSDIGSDHLPIFSTFTITNSKNSRPKPLESDEKETAETIIKEGEKAVETEE
jgi:endonuclease/exonuclease/phosphatase (EEP) superfamily protein YafD